MATVQAPSFPLVDIANLVLDTLIKGLGEDAAIAAATAYAPWLALPIINWIFKQIVSVAANALDTQLKAGVDIVIIRFGNDIRKKEYDAALEPVKAGKATPDEIQKARDAIDALVHRGGV